MGPVPTIPCPVCKGTRVFEEEGKKILCGFCYPAVQQDRTPVVQIEVERLEKLNTILKSRLQTSERRAWQNREKMKAAEATRDKLQAHLIKAIDEKEAMEASFKTMPSAQWRAT